MKKTVTIFVLLAIIGLSKAFSQCTNPDFSSDNFSGGWSGSVGSFTSGGDNYTVVTGSISQGADNAGPYTSGQQTIMTISATDPNTNGGLNVIPPNGGYSCRLGNAQYQSCDGASQPQAARLKYTFTPNASNSLFTYRYAVVLEQAGHSQAAMPKFTINVLNAAGQQIGGVCGTYTTIAKPGLPGFTECFPTSQDPTCGADSVLWCNWKTVSLDLSGYVGTTVSIEFTTFDCTLGGHFGYAYIQCSCGIPQIMQTCNGASDILSGPPGYAQYAWSPSTGLSATTGSTVTLANAATYNGQTYTITCTPVTGIACQVIVKTVINNCQPQLSQQCLGDSVIITAPAGFSTYTWNTGDSTQSIIVNNPIAGDTVSCICTSATDTITLKAGVFTIPVTGLTTTSALTCSGDTAMITASGGVFTYFWNTGQTGASIQVAPYTTTTYTVIATSSGGCTASITAIVTVNPLPKGDITYTPSNCTSPTGTITITPTVGTAPFTYSWNTSPQQTTQTATGLSQGSYIVVLTDSNGCSSAIAGNVPPSSIIHLVTSSTNEHCGEADGTAGVTPSGGVSPYSYLWSTVPVQQITATATSLPASAYTVTITDSAGCTATATVTINNMPGPAIQFTNIVSDSCGVNDGSSNTVISGGSAPFTYHWSNGENSNALVNVPAGNYCVTVTDTYNCSATNCVTINSIPLAAPEICIVTTDTSSNHCMVVWEKPVTNAISKYYIYRESAVAGVYNLIGTQNYSNMSTYIDSSSNPLQQSYRYELAINDICGDTTQQSAYHQTIHLSISAGSNGEWNLIWNDYIGFTFGTYNIYRGTNTSNLTLLDNVSSNFKSYTDLTPPTGTVYYLVEVVRPTSCNPSTTTNSISSTISNIASGIGSGITEFNANNFIQVSPNPGIDNITIENIAFRKGQTFSVYDIEGQLLLQQPMLHAKTNIDISAFSKGLYFLKVENENGIAVKKFIKE